jgi:hypothetical protein
LFLSIRSSFTSPLFPVVTLRAVHSASHIVMRPATTP